MAKQDKIYSRRESLRVICIQKVEDPSAELLHAMLALQPKSQNAKKRIEARLGQKAIVATRRHVALHEALCNTKLRLDRIFHQELLF